MSDAASGPNEPAAAAIVAIYPDRAAAASAVARLTAAGFPAGDVGVVATEEETPPASSPTAAGHLRNAARGVLFGAILGVLLSVEAVFLGQGGPVAEIGSADEVILYGIPTGALSRPDPMTEEGSGALYRDELRRGRVLVIAHAPDDAGAERARAALAGTDPLDLRVQPVDLDIPPSARRSGKA